MQLLSATGYAGTVVNDTSVGTIAWTSPEDASGPDSPTLTYASAVMSGTAQTNYLKATNFGFSLPSTAVIVGVDIAPLARRISGTAGAVNEASCKIVKGGVITGDDHFASASYPLFGGSSRYQHHGGAYTTWGTSLTYSDVNSTDFGAAYSVQGSTSSTDRTSQVSQIAIIVYYYETPPPYTVLTSGFDSTAGTTATTASISPVEDKLVLAWVYTRSTDLSNGAAPTISGGGLTWTQVATIQDSIVDPWLRMTLFKAYPSTTPAGGALTITAGESMNDFEWSVIQIDNAIDVTSSVTKSPSGVTTTYSQTLPEFSKINNYTMMATAVYHSTRRIHGYFTGTTTTSTTTQAFMPYGRDARDDTPTHIFMTHFHDHEETEVSGLWYGVSASYVSIAVEIETTLADSTGFMAFF